MTDDWHERVLKVIQETTCAFRKGEEVTTKQVGALQVTDVWMMPSVDQINPEMVNDTVQVDMHFFIVAVSKSRAEAHREEFIQICKEYPEPERLAAGPSYIESGAVIGSQELVFHFYALGEVLKLWEVITPERMRITGPKADELAGGGFVMMTGFKG